MGYVQSHFLWTNRTSSNRPMEFKLADESSIFCDRVRRNELILIDLKYNENMCMTLHIMTNVFFESDLYEFLVQQNVT